MPTISIDNDWDEHAEPLPYAPTYPRLAAWYEWFTLPIATTDERG